MSFDLTGLLNEKQLEGATCTSQYTRIIAGAGSGKTRVLTYRIAHLIENEYVYPSTILAITFTNKAGKEIKERVAKQLGDARGLFLGTIHSWCARFLRSEHMHIGYPSSFSILDEDDQFSIMKEILSERHGLGKRDPNIKSCLNWIGSQKTKGFQYNDLKDTKFPNPTLNEYLQYWKEYDEVLFERKSLDFDDLLLKTIDILSNRENGVWDVYSKKYSHILVDEFQDINDVQFKLITLLMNKDTNLYVVGDPDQTIYTWRGANNDIIMNMDKRIRESLSFSIGIELPKINVNTIILERNYRSTKKILDCANKLIKQNSERVEKNLYTKSSDGDDIIYKNARTTQEEAQWVASTINDIHKRNSIEYKDIAVLYRANYLTREIETNLNYFGIPYKVFGGQKFYQRKEIKDIVSYFRLIVNDADDTAFDRVINVPRRGIGETTYEKIKLAAKQKGSTVFIFLKNNYKHCGILSKRQIDLFEVLFDAIDLVRDKIDGGERGYIDLLKSFIEKIGYFKFLEETENDFEERKDNIDELLSSVDSFMNDNPDVGFEEFVANAILQSSQDEIVGGNFVSLMTVHSAKGLEFNNVFVYGLCESVFPSKRAIFESKKGIEEERRLAYVAYTRARNKLYLSCNNEYSYVAQESLKPSRFFKEAGIEIKSINSGYFDEDRRQYMQQSNQYKRQDSTSSTSINASSFTKPSSSSFIQGKTISSSMGNGIKSWNVGDRIEHAKYGKGTVVEVISTIINVQFDDNTIGKKALLGSHISIKKI